MFKAKRSNFFGLGGLLLIVGLVAVALAVNLTGAYGQTAKGLVDLNSASLKEMESVKGIGAATAKKIIAGRPYSSLDDLKKAGLSAKQIESFKSQVTVGAAPAAVTPKSTEQKPAAAPAKAAVTKTPTPAPQPPAAKPAAPKPAAGTPTKTLVPGQHVNINTASKEDLDALPGIGPVKAQAIVDGRPYDKIEDIMKVKGIKEKEFGKIKEIISVK
jgi:competence protein ComEA